MKRTAVYLKTMDKRIYKIWAKNDADRTFEVYPVSSIEDTFTIKPDNTIVVNFMDVYDVYADHPSVPVVQDKRILPPPHEPLNERVRVTVFFFLWFILHFLTYDAPGILRKITGKTKK